MRSNKPCAYLESLLVFLGLPKGSTGPSLTTWKAKYLCTTLQRIFKRPIRQRLEHEIGLARMSQSLAFINTSLEPPARCFSRFRRAIAPSLELLHLS